MNEAAFNRNTHPEPTAAISTPASAGPIMRAALNEVELRPTAFDKSSSPTNSETKVWFAGESKAVVQPSRNANTYTCHSSTSPVTVSIPKPSAKHPSVA